MLVSYDTSWIFIPSSYLQAEELNCSNTNGTKIAANKLRSTAAEQTSFLRVGWSGVPNTIALRNC
jgi:hypothetical protein